jgi:uncharacterized protein
VLTQDIASANMASPANKGIFSSAEAALDAVVSRLVDALDPFAIWLFGSRARGDAKPGSDFDLLVVAKPDGGFGSNDYRKVLRPVHETWVGCDVIPCSKADFDEAASLHTSFVASVIREGKLLYGGGA